MTRSRGVVAALVGLALTVALAAGSRVPWSAHSSQEAQLVLSWRAVSESRDLCREPTEEDLTGLPPHMRPDRICEERLAEYGLSLEIDGVSMVDRTVRPAGARGDRPVYVLEKLNLAPGPHRIAIQFDPLDSSGAVTNDANGPAGIQIDRLVDFTAGRVVLVTRDGDRGDFIIRHATQPD